MANKSLPTGYSRVVNAKLDTIFDADQRVVGFMTNDEDQFIAYTQTLTGDYTVTTSDDGVVFTCTAALTITIPELLSPRPSFIVNPPASGNVSIDPTGAAQLNGAGTTLTRSRTSNPAGFVVTAYAESDGYGVSGS